MKNLAEMLELTNSLPSDERARRVCLIQALATMLKEIGEVVRLLDNYQVFGAAAWLVADSRALLAKCSILIMTVRDMQFHSRKLLNVREVAKRKPTNSNPGKTILEFLRAANVSAAEFAKLIDRKEDYVNELIHNRRAITVETAKLLEEATGSSAESWLTMQMSYSLSNSKEPTEAMATALRERFKQ